jgi:hypothetical protein
MGPGIVLYFRFLVLALVVVLIFVLGYSILSIVSNIQKYQPSKPPECPHPWTFQISNLNAHATNKEISSYILGGLTIALLIAIPITVKVMANVVHRCYSAENHFHYTQPFSLLFILRKPTSCTEATIISTIN